MAIALKVALACVLGIALVGAAPVALQNEAFRGRVIQDARIAPDGRWVVFTRSEGPPDPGTPTPASLWRIPFAGGDAQRLTTTSSLDSHPRWSPDGEQVAFLSAPLRRNSPGRIFMMPAGAGAARAITTESIDAVAFEWSPSGRRIAFVTSGSSPGLWVMDASGTGQRRIIEGSTAAFAWAPDDDTIARVVSAASNGAMRVEVIDVDGTAAPLTIAADVLPRVSWSRDGASIALPGRREKGPNRVLVVQPGSSVRDLPIAGAGSLTDVVWIANGVLSLTFATGAETWIEQLTAATGDRITVMPPGIATLTGAPSWSLDGNRYVVVGSTQEHAAEVFAGTIPLPEGGRADTVGARPPPVRRITFSDR